LYQSQVKRIIKVQRFRVLGSKVLSSKVLDGLMIEGLGQGIEEKGARC
jgi:hypothetical protein